MLLASMELVDSNRILDYILEDKIEIIKNIEYKDFLELTYKKIVIIDGRNEHTADNDKRFASDRKSVV